MDPEMQQAAPPADGEAPAPEEQDTFDTMVAGIREHLFSEPVEKGVREQLRAASDIAREMGAITMVLCMEAGRQAQEVGAPVETDMLIGLATEIIDDLLMIAEAMGLIESAEDDGLREEALMHAVNAYLQQANPTEDERGAAMQMLEMMMGDGEVDEAAGELQRMGAARGVDPMAEDEQPADAPAPAGMSLMGG